MKGKLLLWLFGLWTLVLTGLRVFFLGKRVAEAAMREEQEDELRREREVALRVEGTVDRMTDEQVREAAREFVRGRQ